MAVDEALLEDAAETGRLWLRLYQWEPATLSLGYFQPHCQRQGHLASLGCPLVRRASGGGAILHDRELTYSLCVPQTHALAARSALLYEQVHRLLVAWLRGHSIGAEVHRIADSGAGKAFLCFQRREPGDVVLAGFKVCGSAQRRRRGAILQHGSILCQRSPWAPELPGIADLVAHWPGVEGLRAFLAGELGSVLSGKTEMANLPPEVAARAAGLVRDRYGSVVWNLRK